MNNNRYLYPFNPGKIVVTSGIAHHQRKGTITPYDLVWMFDRHVWGDWGEVDREDWQTNNASLTSPDWGYVLSAYTTSSKVKVWIITEIDHSVTTMLLPDEY
jgi:hypothetical protein